MSVIFVAGIAMPVEGYHHLWEMIGADEQIDMYHGRHPKTPMEFISSVSSVVGKNDIIVGHSLGSFIALSLHGKAKRVVMIDPPMSKPVRTGLAILPALPKWTIYSVRKIGLSRHSKVGKVYFKNLLLHFPKYMKWLDWLEDMTLLAIERDVPTISSYNDDFSGWFWKTRIAKTLENSRIFNYPNHASMVVDYLPDGSPGPDIREASRTLLSFIGKSPKRVRSD